MIKIISAYTQNLQPMIDISRPILHNYCAKHGHEYEIFNIPHNYARPFSWFKIEKLIEETSLMRNEYIMWIDADAIIVNDDFSLKSILEPNKYFYVSKDMHNINCGVFIIKNNEYIRNLLQSIWNKTQFISHCWWEQAAIIDIINNNENNFNEYIKYIPQKILNAYDYSYYPVNYIEGQVDGSSFVFHAPSLSFNTRLELIKKYGAINDFS